MAYSVLKNQIRNEVKSKVSHSVRLSGKTLDQINVLYSKLKAEGVFVTKSVLIETLILRGIQDYSKEK